MLPELDSRYSKDDIYNRSPIGKRMAELGNPISEWLGLHLGNVWLDYEDRLATIDIVKAIESKTVSQSDYQAYLLNMRQQVKEGSRWITRAASSMDDTHVLLRNALISHAAEEHRDFQMLERDFEAMGGDPSIILTAEKNIGSEALHAYIFAEASKPNPTQAFGATFIIEGMGTKKAGLWATCIKEALNVDNKSVSFLSYHGGADEDHYENLIKVLASPFVTEDVAVKLVKCAKVVARLYALQLEELNNF